MTPESVITLGQEAMKVTLLVAGPMLAGGMIVGLLISIFQAATHINEMTMTFVPKIITVFVVMVLSLPWIINQLTSFTVGIFDRIAAM
ncbi:MAG TPA: flagellar biosynthesis protein FliQ [Candidatus Krumholzibacteria bacterium]|nr:flagellar biosynthesis protein FliQ [Candidatus Krumholzibacteria bacterium]HRX50928.1 flagellar biosynthesis protein FliQ [Candidatus Krumholzibacteria bacterium]